MHRGYRGVREKPERPADPAVRRANLRRIARLFTGYRGRLSAVLALILFSAALGVVTAFLLRGVLQAIVAHDTNKLSLYAGGMIAIAVATGVLGVWQTLLSNQVGQRVMHGLRTAVFRHLQRLSLAFFTRTRTGEVQSRISNDIGGVQNVVTSTATSIVSNVTTVIASMIGMIALSWELSLFAFALVPVFVLLTRRVGDEYFRTISLFLMPNMNKVGYHLPEDHPAAFAATHEGYEALRWRVKDLDFDYRQIIVREGKRNKDSITVLPTALIEPLKTHLLKIKGLHEQDLRIRESTDARRADA